MKKRWAFTLIELLVVISIIALLLSILMPALSKVRDQGRKAVCLANLKQVGTAIEAYAADNKGRYPQSIGVYLPNQASGLSIPKWSGDLRDEKTVAAMLTWWGLLGPYQGLDKNKYGTSATATNAERKAGKTLGHCPNHTEKYDTIQGLSFSYHGNGNLLTSVANDYSGAYDISAQPAFSSANVRQAGSKVIVFEIHTDADWPVTYLQRSAYSNYMGKKNKWTNPNWYLYDWTTKTGWAGTHGNYLNYLFCDGHAASISNKIYLSPEKFLPYPNFKLVGER